MPTFFKALLGGLAVICGSVLPALSADMPRLPPPPPPVFNPPVFKDPMPMPTGGSKIFPYFRLDGSIDIYRDTDGISVSDTFSVDWPNLGLNIGVGAGLALNDYLRLDVTAEYRAVNDISLICKSSGTNCITHDLDSVAFFANGYVDLGHFSGLTPYIGAGIGAAAHRVKNLKIGALSGTTSERHFDFAWNVQAGASFDVSKHASLDLNYRYTDLGGFTGNSTVGTNVTEVKFNDIRAHDIRFGLRYYID